MPLGLKDSVLGTMWGGGVVASFNTDVIFFSNSSET